MSHYAIAPDRSHVWIEARSSLHAIHQSTDGLEGFVELTIDQTGAVDLSEAPAGKLMLSVTRLSSGNALEDRELHKRIDARRYPTIEGVLRSIRHGGSDSRYRVGGDLTFHGVQRGVEDEMTITSVDDHTLRMEGESRFDIRDFGMEPPRILMFRVEPDVLVRIEVYATKEDESHA